MNGWYITVLLVLPSIMLSSSVFGQVEPWMRSNDIRFHRAGWWWGGYSSAMMGTWGGEAKYVIALTVPQKVSLWEKMTHAQCAQMSAEYGKIQFGMGGYLHQRPEEWNSVLNERIAAYARGVRGLSHGLLEIIRNYFIGLVTVKFDYKSDAIANSITVIAVLKMQADWWWYCGNCPACEK